VLFIFAATAVKFISNPQHQSERRLSRLIESLASNSDLGLLDALYAVILQDAISDDDGNKDEEVQRRIYKLLAMIIFSQEGLSFTAMTMLGGFNDGELRVDLVALSSVVSSIDHIHFYHSSFLDYLCSDRRQHPVLPRDGHTALANGCLLVISVNLQGQNICQLDDGLCLNDDIANLKARTDYFIPSGLRYACVYLMQHLSYVDVPFDPSVRHGLDSFCRGHVLHWVEALSLLRSTSIIMANLHDVALRIEVSYTDRATGHTWLIIYTAIWYIYRKQCCTSAARRAFSHIEPRRRNQGSSSSCLRLCSVLPDCICPSTRTRGAVGSAIQPAHDYAFVHLPART
jgi:hypothetical protein